MKSSNIHSLGAARPKPAWRRVLLCFPILGLCLTALPAAETAQVVTDDALQSQSSINDLPNVDQKIEMDRKQVYEIPAPGVQRFLIVDPAIAYANPSPDGNRIFVEGLTFGMTYLHVWTDQGRKTLLIKVAPPGASKKAKERPSDFQMSNQLASYLQSSRDYASGRENMNRVYSYAMNMEGKSPFGYSQTSLIAERREDFNRIAQLRTKVGNGWGELGAGDVLANGSQLTLPFFNYQGVSYATPRSDSLGAQFFGGYTNQQFWGQQSSYLSQPENSFVGAKAAARPVDGMEVFVAGTKVMNGIYPERSQNLGIGTKIEGGGFKFQTEGARSSQGRAIFGDLQYKDDLGYASLSSRKVDRDYVTLTGGSWARGESGILAQAGLNPNGILRALTWQYNRYVAGYSNNKNNPGAINEEWRGQFRIGGTSSGFTQEVILQDMPGTLSASKISVVKSRLDRKIGIWEPNVAYRHETGNYYESPLTNYAENALGYGMRVQVSKNVSYTLAGESVWAQRPGTGQEASLFNFGTSLRVQGSLGSSLKQSLQMEYRHLTQRFSEESRIFSSQLRLDYGFSRSMAGFLIGAYSLTAGINPGHTASVNVGVQWGNGLSVPGFHSHRVVGSVFKDLNGDGIRQKEEPGIANVKLNLNGKRIALTDADGRYRFRPMKGELAVLLDKATLPSAMRLNASNPQVYSELEDARRIEADFPIAYLGEATGRVWVDLNENGAIDAEDQPLARIVLSAEAHRGVTDAQGVYSISGLEPGKHKVQMDILTLPPNFVCVTPSQVGAEFAEGDRKEFLFLVRPERSISGTAFWDKNGNGSRDLGEPTVAGVKVKTSVSEFTTEGDGFYYLNHFKAGTVTLDVDPDSIRGQWSPAKSLPETYTVKPGEPFILKKDLPLKKLP